MKGDSASHHYTDDSIRKVLMREPSPKEFEPLWPAKIPGHLTPELNAWLPSRRTPAAVLIPVVRGAAGLSILLTRRSAHLSRHAGQISFPGGRIERDDPTPWDAALRETREEIGLDTGCVEFAGYLPDHLVGSGFRVTPAVGFVSAPLHLSLAPGEVQEAFEIPLDVLFDGSNHSLRRRLIGQTEVQFHDIRFHQRSIWGATAGILMTWKRLVDSTGETG